jgi:hypothetical protein
MLYISLKGTSILIRLFSMFVEVLIISSLSKISFELSNLEDWSLPIEVNAEQELIIIAMETAIM